MKNRAFSPATWGTVLLAAAWLGLGGVPRSAATAPCVWAVDRQHGLATHSSFLMNVSGRSASDVWAVGAHFDGGAGTPLTQRWDGARWQEIPAPNVGDAVSGLQDVVAIGSDDAWAVGHVAGKAPMVQHWDGARWQLVTTPDLESGPTELLGVAATSASDVWAVGKTSSGPDYRTLIERFDGAGWHTLPSPNVGPGDNVLRDVDALSGTNAWAVGWRIAGRRYLTLAVHWDGNAWHVSLPSNVGTGDSFLSGVSVVSPTDVWAVGWASTGPDTSHTLIEHWDGRRWRVVESPSPGSGANSLFAIDVLSATDIWAVGSSSEGSEEPGSLVEHWDGATWQVVQSPDAGPTGTFLAGITTGAGPLWAVGTRVDTGGTYRSLVARGC
jgi:hypothetical protein